MINKSATTFFCLFCLFVTAVAVGAEKDDTKGDKPSKPYECSQGPNGIFCDCKVGECGDMMDVCEDSMECEYGYCICEADKDKLRVIDPKRYGKEVSNVNTDGNVVAPPPVRTRDHRKPSRPGTTGDAVVGTSPDRDASKPSRTTSRKTPSNATTQKARPTHGSSRMTRVRLAAGQKLLLTSGKSIISQRGGVLQVIERNGIVAASYPSATILRDGKKIIWISSKGRKSKIGTFSRIENARKTSAPTPRPARVE